MKSLQNHKLVSYISPILNPLLFLKQYRFQRSLFFDEDKCSSRRLKEDLVDWLDDRSIAAATGLYSVAIDTWGVSSGETALAGLLTTIVIDVFEVEGVNVAWDIAKDC